MASPRTTPKSDSNGESPTREAIERVVRRVFAPHLRTPEGGRIWQGWRGTLRLLRPLGRVSLGNAIDVYANGDDAFEAIWEALAGARTSVLVNTYIFEPDAVGRRTMDELVAAAQRGCEVVLVVDAFGSHGLEEILAPLREAGGSVFAYNPMLRLRTRMPRLVRNHRKIIVVDDRIAFCGGMNISEDYAGVKHGTRLFRDTHLRLRGPCVQDLASLVLQLVAEISGRAWREPSASPSSGGGSLVQILESNIRRQRRAIQRALRYTIRRAVSRCYLTSPYFVPPKRLMRDMQRAAQRGVDVRVLTSGKSDVPLVRLASQHLYGRLVRAGVRIYEMHERVLHSKTASVDGVYGSVGSFNLDYWSYRRNLEVSVSVLDEEVSCRIERRFLRDVELAGEVEYHAWSRRRYWRRLVQWLAYQLMRI